MRRSLLVLPLLTACSAAHAFDMCKYIQPGSPAGCNDFKISSGGSIPSQSAAHRLNPGSVPVTSPYGLESIVSPAPDSDAAAKYGFSLVKGFKQFGTGISTDGDDNFFTHSYTLAARNTYLEKTYERIYAQNDAILRTLNLATAIPIPVGRSIGRLMQPTLGVLARYNRPMHQWGGGVGLNAASKYLSLGVSYVNQPNEYERTHIPMLVLMGGVGVGPLRVDYARLNYLKGLLQDQPVNLWTVSLNWRRFIVFAGRRSGQNLERLEIVDYLYGVQYLVSRNLALGTMLNYIPGRLSVGAQIFL